ncbi:MAG: hypothetical protein KDE63_07960 [Novosphingobium sp.]|nr:hypothetical protein [Rhizobiaceae bacterium]MCB2051350.1 hypothetical protein [Novosphingobium sp.]
MFGSTAKIIVQFLWSICLFGVGIWLTQLWPGSVLELWGWFLKYGALIPITVFTVVLSFRGLRAWLMFQSTRKRRAEAGGKSLRRPRQTSHSEFSDLQ